MFIGFIIGFIAGGVFGIFVAALGAAAKYGDMGERLMLYEHEERRRKAEDTKEEILILSA